MSLKHLNLTLELQGPDRCVPIPSVPVQKVTWTCAEVEVLTCRKFDFQVKGKSQLRAHRTFQFWRRWTKSAAATSHAEALRGKLLAASRPDAAWSQCRHLWHWPSVIFCCWSCRVWQKTLISTVNVLRHQAFSVLGAVWVLSWWRETDWTVLPTFTCKRKSKSRALSVSCYCKPLVLQ